MADVTNTNVPAVAGMANPLIITPAANVWKFAIPGYLPPSLNTTLRQHWSKRKKECQRIDNHFGLAKIFFGIPNAQCRRRVDLVMRGTKPRDYDNCWKMLLDSLVRLGLLIDDSAKFVECGKIDFKQRGGKELQVILTDLEPETKNG